MKDNKFTFFESYHKALSRLTDEQYGRVVRAIGEYAFNGIEPNFTDISEWMAWELIKPIIDNGMELSKTRSVCGAIGGANGKGVSRNQGNKFAAKDESLANISKTIANENFANEESIATDLQNNSGRDKERKGQGRDWECGDITHTPPQLDDVVLYFNLHDKNKVSNPNKFFSHFESMGWMRNGQPIINWQSRADLWISEDIKKSANKPQPINIDYKLPSKEDLALAESKRKESQYERFRGMIEQVKDNPESLARVSLEGSLNNGSLDSYPDLKNMATLLITTF